VGEFDEGSRIGVSKSLFTNFHSSQYLEGFGVALCPVTDDETIFALSGELVGNVVGLIDARFRDSLYPSSGPAIGGVKDFSAPSVDGGDDEAVGETSRKGRQIEARDPNHGNFAGVSEGFGCGEPYSQPGEKAWADINSNYTYFVEIDAGLRAKKLDRGCERFSVAPIAGSVEGGDDTFMPSNGDAHLRCGSFDAEDEHVRSLPFR
jgi:hypothetical protein